MTFEEAVLGTIEKMNQVMDGVNNEKPNWSQLFFVFVDQCSLCHKYHQRVTAAFVSIENCGACPIFMETREACNRSPIFMNVQLALMRCDRQTCLQSLPQVIAELRKLLELKDVYGS